MVLVSGLSVLLSNLVSNVPAVLLFRPLMDVMPQKETAWLALAMSSTLAGNLTVLGSVANLIVVENARRAGTELGFVEYLKVGVPLTILTTLVGVAWLALTHYWGKTDSERPWATRRDSRADGAPSALDALNVVLADVRDGLGPYLAIYLATRHWDPSKIGMAMSAMGITSVIAQTPAGALIDRTTRKRSWMVAAASMIALGAVAMAWMPKLPVVILGAQAIIGVASAIFAPAIAAVSLGLVGHARMSRRTGRNEAFNHAGNVIAAILAGVIGDYIAYEGIFYLLAGMCLLSIVWRP